MNNREQMIHNVEILAKFCRLYVNKQKNLPVAPTQMALMLHIAQCDEPCTPLMAAQFFNVKKSIVSKNVKALEGAGMIEKVPSKEDKRSYNLKLSPKGSKVVEENFIEFSYVLQIIKDGLGDQEFQSFMDVMDRVNGILKDV